MLLTPSLNSTSKMKPENLVKILNKLKEVVQELETEIKSDPSKYKLDVPYEEVLEYYMINDDDGWTD